MVALSALSHPRGRVNVTRKILYPSETSPAAQIGDGDTAVANFLASPGLLMNHMFSVGPQEGVNMILQSSSSSTAPFYFSGLARNCVYEREATAPRASLPT